MPHKFIVGQIFALVYANDLDPFVPEHWAQESLAILEENIN